MIESIRVGESVQGLLPTDTPRINWRTVKSVTIKKISPRYYAESGDSSTGRLVPFASLDAEVDTGQRVLLVEIHCPLLGDAKP
jgi:hypothetical protein